MKHRFSRCTRTHFVLQPPATIITSVRAGQECTPLKLFLYQDGAREHDLPGIEACREVQITDRLGLQSPSHVSGEELWLRPFGIHLTKMGFFYG